MITQNDYTQEIIEKTNADQLLELLRGDQPLDELAQAAAETAYRRGYYQGFDAAIDASESGVKLNELLNHHESTLYWWRHTYHNSKVEQPPIVHE